jgi:hypothetical protein
LEGGEGAAGGDGERDLRGLLFRRFRRGRDWMIEVLVNVDGDLGGWGKGKRDNRRLSHRWGNWEWVCVGCG